MGRRGVAVAGAVLAVAMAIAACSANDPPGGEGRLSIATGGSGGVYQVFGGGLAELMSEELPDSPTTAETTSASVDNLTLVANGDSDVAFTLADTAIDAVRGSAGFERPLPLRALATLYPNITQVVVKADSGITTLEQLRGKTVSVGSPNSGTEVIALRLLEAAGLDPERDLSKRGLGVGESVAAVRDGSIDAFFWSGGVPTAAVTDLATTDEIRILDVSRYLPALRKRYGEAYEAAQIDKGEYEGVPATKTIGVPNLLVVNAGMSERMTYDITRVLMEGKPKLAKIHKSAAKLDPKTGQEVVAPVRLHPGAERFYAEQGK
jgi:TRAP transporter TAXI family solute receptor